MEAHLEEVVKKLWMQYRHSPILPGSIGELRRGALRGIIGCYSSKVHLEDTIRFNLSDGYKEGSSFIQTLRTRMKEVESNLQEHLRVLTSGEELRT